MPNFPALLTSADLWPGQAILNGRRWAGHQLLLAWARACGSGPMALAAANPQQLQALLPQLRAQDFSGDLHGLSLIDPSAFCRWGGLFIPDPSIGRWGQWRAPLGSAAFSLIGQIHTLSTPAVLEQLQELVSEPLQPWDALVCSSTAGRAVVEAVMADREEQLVKRCGGQLSLLRAQRLQLPVIPLPIQAKELASALPNRQEARQKLDLAEQEAVVLWLGRLSFLTKADPWPSYLLLERVAAQLQRPLTLIECGADDSRPQAEQLEKLRSLCPSLRFLRLGGEQPVAEAVKAQALAAADVALSLVDNPQETFGLSVAEAMAAALPVVASDWDGYRDLIRPGVDGFLVPSRWAASAAAASRALGWQQRTGLQPFQAIAGALGQLVQLDLGAAEDHLLTLLRDPGLALAMGRAGQIRAQGCFDAPVVMARYGELFTELTERRAGAPLEARQASGLALALDPVNCFSGFASPKGWSTPAPGEPPAFNDLPAVLKQARQAIWQLLEQSVPADTLSLLHQDLARKHQCPVSRSGNASAIC